MASVRTRVLFVLPTHKFDIFIQGLVRNSSNNFEFNAILFDGNFTKEPILGLHGYEKTYSLGNLAPKSLMKNIIRCRRLIKSMDPDIVHVTSYLSAITVVISIMTLKRKPKFLWNRHYNKGHHNLNSKIHVLIDKLITSRSDATIVISHAQLETMVYAEHSDPSKIQVINNGIDLDLLKVSNESRQYFRQMFRGKGGLVLLAVGRLHVEKDYLTLFTALVLLQQKGYKFHLFIAGDGNPKYIEFLHDRVAELNLTNVVTYLGWVDEIHSAMLECDLLVQASLDEAFGLSILEASALGIPVATTTPGGVVEIISEFHPFVAPGDSLALAEIMAEKAFEPSEKLEYISGKMLERFPVSKMAIKYNVVYEKLNSRLKAGD